MTTLLPDDSRHSRPGPWFYDDDRPGIRARIVADSINPAGDRLTTLEVTFNRYILAELNTHRMLSRNSASSRAIPIGRVIRQVWSNPAVPIHWGANKRGMQAADELSGFRLWLARRLFLLARIPMIVIAWILSKVGLHKQVTNRLLEPWVWHTAVVSMTERENFFKLRDHPAAQPEFRSLAVCMRKAITYSVPRRLKWGEWHTPYVGADEVIEHADPLMMSVARCAAVSYNRQNDRKSGELAERLASAGHWSPFEHVALAVSGLGYCGNFRGWKQLRKFYPEESGRIEPAVCTCGGAGDLYDCEAHPNG